MDTKALRQKILDLAIRGKLVPQDPNDEPASVLLERIREQKKQMVKDGKLKEKDIKNDTIIFVGEDNLHYEKFQNGTVKCIEDEIPFEVPAGWEWERIGSVCILNPRNNISDNLEVSFIPMPLISEGYANTHTYEIRTWNNVKSGFTHFAENDIGVAKITPCFENRKSVIFKKLVNGYGAGTTELHILRTLDNTIVNEFLLWIVKMDSFIQGGVQTFSGAVGQQRVSKEYLSQYLIPIPPQNEQIRIVQKINSVFKLVISIENDEKSLEEIIKNTKSKIIDHAIRGKLVPQDPNDEPASVLLERIRVEKEELIKQGKIKRDKKESVIFKGEDNSYYMTEGKIIKCIDEELPFKLPQSWKWAHLSDIAQILNGDRGKNYPAKNKLLHSEGIPFVSASNIENGNVLTNNLLYMSDEQYNLLGAGKLHYGDIVYCIRGSLGKCGIFNMNKGAIASSLVIVRTITEKYLFKNYIFLYLHSQLSFSEIKKYNNGSTQPNLAAKDLMKFLIPIPPYNEQLRILNYIQQLNEQMSNIVDAIS